MEYQLCRLDILTAAVNVLASCKDIHWEYRRSARTRIAQVAVDQLHQGWPTSTHRRATRTLPSTAIVYMHIEEIDCFNMHRLKSDELEFLNIIFANKVAILYSVDLLYCLDPMRVCKLINSSYNKTITLVRLLVLLYELLYYVC